MTHAQHRVSSQKMLAISVIIILLLDHYYYTGATGITRHKLVGFEPNLDLLLGCFLSYCL